jgi:serine/threonine protein kinase
VPTSLTTQKQTAYRTRLIGPYKVMGSLGRGGMAEVFEAEHRHLGQIRALKVLLPEISARPELVDRLLAEARAMARLRHPAIVEVFDCDVLPDGTAFIAMECLRGEPLRLWQERAGKLAEQPMLAAAIVGRIGEGLAFAHQQGVVHRDLKPENILLVPDPREKGAFAVKILDFGVAKMLRDERPRTPTLDGCVIGTPVCMAPEQWRPGAEIDHRADIYALGCLFFETLCGRPPFLETDDVQIMHAHLEATPPSVRALEANLPAGFDGLISRMLAKAPEDRPQTVEEVLVDLEALIGLERSRWGSLLRTPPGWPAVAPETAARSTQPALSAVPSVPRAPSRSRSLASRWDRAGRDPRTRLALFGCLGMLATSAVVGALLLRSKEGSATSPPVVAAAPSPARITATPLARSAPKGPFKVRLSSEPAGAEAWVEGERAARGRTPLELVFQTTEPQVIRVQAPGFRTETLLLAPDKDPVARARLLPAPTAAIFPEPPAEPASHLEKPEVAATVLPAVPPTAPVRRPERPEPTVPSPPAPAAQTALPTRTPHELAVDPPAPPAPASRRREEKAPARPANLYQAVGD